MKHPLCMLLLLSASAVGFAKEPPVERAPSPKPMANGARPDVPAWHDRYDLPWEVAPAELKFDNAEIQAMLLRVDAAARESPRLNGRRGRGAAALFYLYWNSGSPGGYWRMYSGRWESGTDTRHSIGLLVDIHAEDKFCHGFQLVAAHQPPGEWRSSLGFSKGAESLGFNLALFHSTHTAGKSFGEPNIGLRVAPGTTAFFTRRRVGNRDVRVLIENYWRPEGDGFRYATVDEIAAYWKSPASFRDASLAEYDRLAENCRKQIESGIALELWSLGGPTGADPPMRLGPDGKVDETLKVEILREALTYVDERKSLINEHYEAMHRSATRAFPPLVEVISLESRGEARAK